MRSIRSFRSENPFSVYGFFQYRTSANKPRREEKYVQTPALIRPRSHRTGQPQHSPCGGEMHPMRHVQASVHRAHGRSRHLHAGRNRRSGHLYSLRSVCQCLSARQHRGTRRALRRTRGYRRPGQNRDRKHFAFGACGTGRDLRSRTGCLRRRKNGRAAAGTGRRLCTRHQLCCRSDHHQGGQRADRARYVRQRSPAPVH